MELLISFEIIKKIITRGSIMEFIGALCKLR